MGPGTCPSGVDRNEICCHFLPGLRIQDTSAVSAGITQSPLPLSLGACDLSLCMSNRKV